MAELSYTMTLEDYGLVKINEVIVSDSSQVSEICPFTVQWKKDNFQESLL